MINSFFHLLFFELSEKKKSFFFGSIFCEGGKTNTYLFLAKIFQSRYVKFLLKLKKQQTNKKKEMVDFPFFTSIFV